MSDVSAGKSLAYFAAEVGLTKKQRAFAEAYLADPQRNQTLAAEKAGYADPATQSYAVLRNPKIQQFLELADSKTNKAAEKRFNAAVMKPAELRARLSDQGRGSLMAFLDANGNLDLEAIKAADKGHLVKRFNVSQRAIKVEGEEVILEKRIQAEPADAQGALKELASHYGMAKDKNSQLAPVNFISVVQSMEPGEKAALSKGLEHLYRAMLSTGQVTDIEAEEVE